MKTTDLATLCGYASALPTPFKGERIDADAFASFCEWQIEQGISALVVNGTTGEAPTLTRDEQIRLVAMALEVARGAGPGDRRRGLQFDRACHRDRARRAEGRRRRPARGHALLQQTVAGRAVPAFPRDP